MSLEEKIAHVSLLEVDGSQWPQEIPACYNPAESHPQAPGVRILTCGLDSHLNEAGGKAQSIKDAVCKQHSSMQQHYHYARLGFVKRHDPYNLYLQVARIVQRFISSRHAGKVE